MREHQFPYSILFDTSIATENAGDEIIMDAIRDELSRIPINEFFVRLPTHDYIGSFGKRWVRHSRLALVGGTNLMSSNFLRYRQWRISMLDSLLLRNKALLMGVGWWQYQSSADLISKLIYRLIFKDSPSNLFHSVRDSYTEMQMRKMGISNVINTACPTMWRFVDGFCDDIPREKSESVVLTLTDYNKSPDDDLFLIRQLMESYKNFIFWPQGVGDVEYARSLGITEIANGGVDSLNRILEHEPIDYVGTRLHAGIRSLQKKRRTVILSVDNRSIEIAKDTNLPVIPRSDRERIRQIISAPYKADIRIPEANIKKWKTSLSMYLNQH